MQSLWSPFTLIHFSISTHHYNLTTMAFPSNIYFTSNELTSSLSSSHSMQCSFELNWSLSLPMPPCRTVVFFHLNGDSLSLILLPVKHGHIQVHPSSWETGHCQTITLLISCKTAHLMYTCCYIILLTSLPPNILWVTLFSTLVEQMWQSRICPLIKTLGKKIHLWKKYNYQVFIHTYFNAL